MNKTLNINLAGIVFHIDEDAFEILNNYLNALKNHFKNEEGADEILKDIEGRIAELFTERLDKKYFSWSVSKGRLLYHRRAVIRQLKIRVGQPKRAGIGG